jgi:CheY-like chemotaxis protein
LIVEGDAIARESLAHLLRLEGYDVRTAGDGAEALTHLHSWKPDAIILELHLPVVNGWTFLEQRRKDARLSKVPVVITSAALDDPEELGAQAALRKRYELPELLRVLDALTQPPPPLP